MHITYSGPMEIASDSRKLHSLPGLGTCLPACLHSTYKPTAIVASIDPRYLPTYDTTKLNLPVGLPVSLVPAAHSFEPPQVHGTILEQFYYKLQIVISLCHFVCFRRTTPRDRPQMPQITTAKDSFLHFQTMAGSKQNKYCDDQGRIWDIGRDAAGQSCRYPCLPHCIRHG